MPNLDWPAFGTALWAVSDQLGIRPEWQLPVMALESGLDPSICNAGGCCGLNQLCPGTFENYVNVPASTYRTWSASQQLAGPVLAYWRNATSFGSIRSATRLMQAQLAPGELSTTPSLDEVVYRSPSGGYEGNKGVFDAAGKGYITVQDLATVMAKYAASTDVRDAIARAYALRPDEQPSDPVYGEDFSHSSITPSFLRIPDLRSAGATAAVYTISALALAAAAGYAAQRGRKQTL